MNQPLFNQLPLDLTLEKSTCTADAHTQHPREPSASKLTAFVRTAVSCLLSRGLGCEHLAACSVVIVNTLLVSVFSTTTLSAAVPDHPSVVAYYTFDDHPRDSSANQYDGSLNNVSYDTDIPSQLSGGKSAYWGDDSVARYVSLPIIRELGPRFSVTCWVKLPAGYINAAGGTTLLANSTPGGAGFQFYVNGWNSDNRRLLLGTRSGAGSSDPGTTFDHAISDGAWHHLAMLRDGSALSFYVDGLSVTMADAGVADDFATDLTLRIGHNLQASASLNWAGHMDDFAIWDNVLDAQQLADLADGTDSPAAHLASPVHAVAYYTFDDTADDASGLGYDALLVNLAYVTDVPSALGSGKSLEWGDHSLRRYVEMPELLELNSEFSVSCWAKVPSGYANAGGGSTLLASSIPQVAGFQWYLNSWNSDDRRLLLGTRDLALTSDVATTGSAIMSDGQWHHLALVRSGEALSIFIDGALVSMTDATVNDDFPTGLPLRIGHNFQASANNNWAGQIDDFSVWDGALPANVIAGLASGSDSPANHLVPAWWSARFVDELDGFYRYSTMVDVWLAGGGGLVTVPTYLTTAGDFPYQKRNYSKEGLFTDHWFLVRSLGGWSPNYSGKGEFVVGATAADYDVATRSGGVVLYDWSKLFDRIDPYLDMGYSSLTLVTDGVPWGLTATPETASYGNASPPDDFDEWYDFMAEMGNQLTGEYGSAVTGQFRFRVGTELRGRLNFTDATQLIEFYDATSEGLAQFIPASSPIGVFNYAGNIESVDNGVTHSMLDWATHCASGVNYQSGATGSYCDWFARSIYSHKTTTGQPNIDPIAAAVGHVAQMAEIEDGSGLVVPTWEVHELGFLENEYEVTTSEPGAYGAAWHFSMISQLYSGGFNAIQHWALTEKVGGNELLHGQGWAMMVLDHLLGGKFYLLDAPAESPAGTQYCAYAVDCGSKKYILLSAFNTDRTAVDSRSVTVEVPRDMLSIADTSVLRYTALTSNTSVYDVIRSDLAAAGLLDAPWSTNAETVSRVSAMGGIDAKNHVSSNWASYQTLFEDSLTLKAFTGTRTVAADMNQLVVTVSAPSVMVIVVE